MSALFRWRCDISIRLSPRSDWWCPPFSAGHAACLFISQVCHCWCPSLSVGHAAFLFMCLPGLSLVVSAFFRWPCSISIHLSPRSVTAGVRPVPLAMQHFYWFVSQVCHWWCPPFSAGHAACLFISQVCHCWCPPLSVGHAAFLFLCPRPATGGARPFPLAFLFLRLAGLSLVCPCLLAMKHFCSFASQVGPLLLVSALFRWPCSISIHLSPRSVTAGVSPFPLATQQFHSFVFQVCHCWCPPFSAGHAAFLLICFPGLSLALPPFSAGHVAFLFICLPCDFFLFAALVFSALSAGTGSPVKGSCSFERGA